MYVLILGGAVGIGWLSLAFAWLAIPLLLVFGSFYWSLSNESLGLAGYWLQFSLFWLLGVVFGASGISLNGSWQVLVFVGGIIGCLQAARLFRVGWLAASICFLVAYHIVALLSLWFSPSVAWKASAYQIISNLKVLALFGFLYFFSRWACVESALRKSVPLYVALCGLALIIQWLAPSLYGVIFPNFRIPAENTFYLPSPGIGLFHHPSILAGISAALGIYYFGCFMTQRKRVDLLLFVALTGLLLASNQRQELFAFSCALGVLYFFISRSSLFVRLTLLSVAGIVLLAVFVGLFWESILRELPQWGVGTWQRSVIPRYQLYDGAWTLAKEHFPLGRGIGAYGGVGALKYDLSAYFELGLAAEWWWRDYNHYLLDAYWPNAIGEGGYLGLIFMLLHYVCLFLFFIQQGKRAASFSERKRWYIAAAALLWILGTTPTSPGFQEIMILYFPAAFWVIAQRESERRIA